MSRKKPTAKLKLEGTYRPDRHGDDAIPASVPEPPWPLSDAARSHYDGLVDRLFRVGLVTDVDAEALAMLAEAIEDYLTARSQVNKAGQLILSSKKTLYTNPAYHNMSSAFKRMNQMMSKFGMTPVDRTGLDCGEESGDDAFDALLKRSMN